MKRRIKRSMRRGLAVLFALALAVGTLPADAMYVQAAEPGLTEEGSNSGGGQTESEESQTDTTREEPGEDGGYDNGQEEPGSGEQSEEGSDGSQDTPQQPGGGLSGLSA